MLRFSNVALIACFFKALYSADKAGMQKIVSSSYLKMQLSLRTCDGHHHDLVKRYEISVSLQKTADMFGLLCYQYRSFFFASKINYRIFEDSKRLLSLVEQVLLTHPEHRCAHRFLCGSSLNLQLFLLVIRQKMSLRFKFCVVMSVMISA